VPRGRFGEGSVYDPRDDGYQVLCMRVWPRGVKKTRIDRWLREAAPSKPLLDAYRAGKLDFAGLSKAYLAELDDRPEVLDELRALAREHRHVTLLCWERPPSPCHRHVLLARLR
jgi:uncharacterized protein YeaO (DUF488 family)